MTDRIHADEADTGRSVVAGLLRDQCPQLTGRSLRLLGGSGSDNTMWLMGDPPTDAVVVRLPRTLSAAGAMRRELHALPVIREALGPLVPDLQHAGTPTDVYPYEWSVLRWIDGSDAWAIRNEITGIEADNIAAELARSLGALRALSTDAIPGIGAREAGERGGPIEPFIDELERWLTNPRWHADALLDVPRVRRRAAEDVERAGADTSCTSPHEGHPATWVLSHGDVIAGNVLINHGRLVAIIDWGAVGIADSAQDLSAAWALFEPRARSIFREAMQPTLATWHRARLTELIHAVCAILYYRPKSHPLADVMERTLDRILADS